MRSVAIFLNQSMPLSEVFVYHQASALMRYKPKFLACKTVPKSVEHDIPVHAINNQNGVKGKLAELIFKVTGFNPQLRREVRDSDVVHAHFGPTGWFASHITCQEDKPLIVTLHGFDILKNEITVARDGRLQMAFSQNRHKLAQRADMFICVSEFIKDRAIKFGFPEDKCHVHYMGVSLQGHKHAKRKRKDSEAIRILSVGRLVPVKAHTKLIEAVSMLERDGLNIHLDIIGDGHLRESLEQQAKDSLKSYTFHGAKPHTEVLRMMRESDLFCHTSMTQENGQTEAFGLVVCEAQWAGLPVVAFASGGVPEALDNGKTGLLSEEGNIESLYQNMKEIIENPEQMQAMSNAGPVFVKENFCGKTQTAKLEEIYDMVIENHKS